MLPLIPSCPKMYKLECCLMGHQDTILCLAMSRSGQLLASRGMDRLRIWNIEKKKPLAKLAQLQNPGDLVTSVTWVTHEGDVLEGLCCGTGLGYLTIWRQHPNGYYDFKEVVSKKISAGTEVTAVNADISDGTRDQQVQVWSVDSKYQLYNIFSIELPTTVPWALFFQEGGDVIVFRMYDGKVHTLCAKDGILGSKGTGMMIGAANVDPSHKFFVINNATISFSLHQMGDATCIKTYDTKPQKTYPKQVTFAERGRVIVGRSDNCIMYIFDKTTRDLLQLLQHSKSGQVQTVTTYDTANHYLVAAASSSNDHDNTITIWKKSIKPSPGNRTWAMIRTALQMAMQLLVIAIVGVILYCTMNLLLSYQWTTEMRY
ncbi:WD40-repeat-containing domain protein [Scleroderma yunnanense]